MSTTSPTVHGDPGAHKCHANTAPACYHHLHCGHWVRNLTADLLYTAAGAVRAVVR